VAAVRLETLAAAVVEGWPVLEFLVDLELTQAAPKEAALEALVGRLSFSVQQQMELFLAAEAEAGLALVARPATLGAILCMVAAAGLDILELERVNNRYLVGTVVGMVVTVKFQAVEVVRTATAHLVKFA